MYDLCLLIILLYDKGYIMQIEISGIFEIFCDECIYVIVLLKINMKGGYDVLISVFERVNEIKYFIVM